MWKKKTKHTMYLPEVLVGEILSRLPLASLARFRSTCRRWNALVEDVITENKSYLTMMLIDSKVFLASVDPHGTHDEIVKVTNQFPLKDPLSDDVVAIRHVFHCDGLLLCSTQDNRLVVWNPFLGETTWIQTGEAYTKLDYYAFGKSSSNEYKILRMFQIGDLGPCLVNYRVYDFTRNTWRFVGATNEWFIRRLRSRGTYFKGRNYWVASPSRNGPPEDLLLSFDFSTERFGSVSLPGDHLSYQVVASAVSRDEQQFFVLTTSGSDLWDIDVWMANDVKSTLLTQEGNEIATSWVKMLTVKRGLYLPLFLFCNGMNFLVEVEDRVLVCPGRCGNSGSFLHIVGGDTHVRVYHHDAGSVCSVIVSYLPTMVRIQEGNRKQKLVVNATVKLTCALYNRLKNSWKLFCEIDVCPAICFQTVLSGHIYSLYLS